MGRIGKLFIASLCFSGQCRNEAAYTLYRNTRIYLSFNHPHAYTHAAEGIKKAISFKPIAG
nr:MAG TPA: hypothetical protein [Bacteriophage sp.]